MNTREAMNRLHDVIGTMRRAVPPETRALTPEEVDACMGMGEAPRVPHFGSDEARIRALAADLVRRRGGEIASQLGDLLVAAIQQERRK